MTSLGLGRGSPVWIAIGTVGAAALSFLFQACLSVILSDSSFGAMSSAIVIAVSLSVFASSGVQNVALFLAKREHYRFSDLRSHFMNVWIINSFITIILCATSFVFVSKNGLEYLFIAVLSIILSLFSILGSVWQGVDNFKGVCYYLVAPEVVKTIGVAFIYISGIYDINSAYIIYILLFSTIIPVVFFTVKSDVNKISASRYIFIMKVGFPYAVAGFLFMIYYRSTLVVFSFFGKKEEAGSLAIIYLFMTAILLLPTAISQRYSLGKWHALSDGGADGLFRELRRQIAYAMAFGIPVALAWFLYAPDILYFAYGNRYADAKILASWFAIIFLLRSLCIPLQAATSISELRWGKTYVILFSSASTLMLSYIIVSAEGIMGGLIAGLASETILLIGLSVVFCRRRDPRRRGQI